MLTHKKKIAVALVAIVALAIVFFPLTVILIQDLIGALINPPFSSAQQPAFTLNPLCSSTAGMLAASAEYMRSHFKQDSPCQP